MIDSGSTHNFLDVSTWLALALPLFIEDTFEVKVANGAVLKTRGVSYGVFIKTQGGLECITSWSLCCSTGNPVLILIRANPMGFQVTYYVILV